MFKIRENENSDNKKSDAILADIDVNDVSITEEMQVLYKDKPFCIISDDMRIEDIDNDNMHLTLQCLESELLVKFVAELVRMFLKQKKNTVPSAVVWADADSHLPLSVLAPGDHVQCVIMIEAKMHENRVYIHPLACDFLRVGNPTKKSKSRFEMSIVREDRLGNRYMNKATAQEVTCDIEHASDDDSVSDDGKSCVTVKN
jgi:hypothetical protein